MILKRNYLGQFTDSTDNNFNLIRLLCAWGVLVAHSVPLAEKGFGFRDYIYQLLQISMGQFCVLVFFSISGFLIYRSMTRSSLSSYIIARMLRLFPALILVMLLTVFVLGPLVTSISLQEYFNHPQTWDYFKNLNLLDTKTYFRLPGVFENNPYPGTVNGSLWTLPRETQLYVVTIVIFYAVFLVKKVTGYYAPYLALLALVAALVFAHQTFLDYVATGSRHSLMIALFNCAFLMGAVMYTYRDHILLSYTVAVLLMIGLSFVKTTSLYPLYGTFTIVYTVLVLAYLPKGKLLAFNKLGDYSYGMYIYAFPVQQSLSHWTDLGFIGMVIWATLITLLLSVLSWHYLESPMLGKKKWIQNLLIIKRRRKQLCGEAN